MHEIKNPSISSYQKVSYCLLLQFFSFFRFLFVCFNSEQHQQQEQHAVRDEYRVLQNEKILTTTVESGFVFARARHNLVACAPSTSLVRVEFELLGKELVCCNAV